MFYRIAPLVVRSPRSLRRARAGEKEVVLVARGAFPPAHPTTREAIELMAAGGVAGRRVLDLGCGCGVLGLCALALGAVEVVGCDILRKPMSETSKNLVANPKLRPFLLFKGSTEALDARFDIILANLPYPVQAAKVEEYPRLLNPRGRVIMAGFSDVDSTLLEPSLARHGLKVVRRTFAEDSAQVLAGAGSSTWAAFDAALAAG